MNLRTRNLTTQIKRTDCSADRGKQAQIPTKFHPLGTAVHENHSPHIQNRTHISPRSDSDWNCWSALRHGPPYRQPDRERLIASKQSTYEQKPRGEQQTEANRRESRPGAIWQAAAIVLRGFVARIACVCCGTRIVARIVDRHAPVRNDWKGVTPYIQQKELRVNRVSTAAPRVLTEALAALVGPIPLSLMPAT